MWPADQVRCCLALIRSTNRCYKGTLFGWHLQNIIHNAVYNTLIDALSGISVELDVTRWKVPLCYLATSIVNRRRCSSTGAAMANPEKKQCTTSSGTNNHSVVPRFFVLQWIPFSSTVNILSKLNMRKKILIQFKYKSFFLASELCKKDVCHRYLYFELTYKTRSNEPSKVKGRFSDFRNIAQKIKSS